MLSTPELPNLAGVITLSDVKQKGSGSYAADYVPWAKVMQLLNEKANGWLPDCLLYTSPSPRDVEESRMPSSA